MSYPEEQIEKAYYATQQAIGLGGMMGGNLSHAAINGKASFRQKLDQNLPGSSTFVQNLSNVKKVRPTVEQYPDISEALGQAIVSVMLGKDQPAAALNSAAQAADTALAGK